MRKAKPIFLLFLLAVLGSSIAYYYYSNLPEDNTRESLVRKELLKSSRLLWEVWSKGIYSNLYKDNSDLCPISKDEEDLTRCNENLLSCLVKNGTLRLNIKGQNKVMLQSLLKGENPKLTLQSNGVQLTLKFEKNCNKLFLPNRIYGIGKEKNPPVELRFDNFGSKIFIDKNVTFGNLKTLSEMKGLCAARGMQLVSSHILDAASFHPVDLKNNRPQELLRPWFPWTRNYKSEFPYKAQTDKNFKFDKKYCDYIKSKECQDIKGNALPSWMGLIDPLGGLMEIVRNPLNSKQIIVPSSAYFEIKSKWHRLGLRAGWDGVSFEKRDFEFGSEEETPSLIDFAKLKYGFRCMQEVWR